MVGRRRAEGLRVERQQRDDDAEADQADEDREEEDDEGAGHRTDPIGNLASPAAACERDMCEPEPFRGAGRLIVAAPSRLSLLAMCGGQLVERVPEPGADAHARRRPAGPWMLTWSDEFNGADGSRPDESRWTYDIGGGGWGNQELETYTSRPGQRLTLRGGALVITARSEHYTRH